MYLKSAPAFAIFFIIFTCSTFLTVAGLEKELSNEELDKLYKQWEESDEDVLDEDELEPWERTPPGLDPANIDPTDDDSMLVHGKKGRNVNMFARTMESLDEDEIHAVTDRWESDLFNAGTQITRHFLEPGKMLISVFDGSEAVRVRDYLLMQDTCRDVTISGHRYESFAAQRESREEEERKTWEEEHGEL